MDQESRQVLNSSSPKSAVLSFQDLMHAGRYDAASDYFSLSITRRGKSLCIQITTNDAQPVTYTAITPAQGKFDIASLLFVAQ